MRFILFSVFIYFIIFLLCKFLGFTTYQIWVSGVNETGGLAAVHRLSQSAIQEGILNIQLMNYPVQERARERTIQTVVKLITGLKVSS
jgi:hypothetical protein